MTFSSAILTILFVSDTACASTCLSALVSRLIQLPPEFEVAVFLPSVVLSENSAQSLPTCVAAFCVDILDGCSTVITQMVLEPVLTHVTTLKSFKSALLRLLLRASPLLDKVFIAIHPVSGRSSTPDAESRVFASVVEHALIFPEFRQVIRLGVSSRVSLRDSFETLWAIFSSGECLCLIAPAADMVLIQKSAFFVRHFSSSAL